VLNHPAGSGVGDEDRVIFAALLTLKGNSTVSIGPVVFIYINKGIMLMLRWIYSPGCGEG
jgi:hypothetical protein